MAAQAVGQVNVAPGPAELVVPQVELRQTARRLLQKASANQQRGIFAQVVVGQVQPAQGGIRGFPPSRDVNAGERREPVQSSAVGPAEGIGTQVEGLKKGWTIEQRKKAGVLQGNIKCENEETKPLRHRTNEKF